VIVETPDVSRVARAARSEREARIADKSLKHNQKP